VTERIDPGGGALTGATGDLTPDHAARPFEPGERREIDDAETRGRVTHEQSLLASTNADDSGEPGWGPDEGDPTDAPRDDGYGSTRGLSPQDDVYRMERHAPPPIIEPAGSSRQDGEPRIGGDETIEAEADRF
jgi:hypothetical protein